MEKVVILYNIRSAHNVGSIFRTCDGAGVSKIYLAGYTPAPIDRFGRVQSEIEKTSLGAILNVAWETIKKPEGLFDRLRNKGFQIISVEQHSGSVSLHDFKPNQKTVYIFGNEIDGVSDGICKESDVILEIPMHGKKESLNVGVSAGIVLFHQSPK